MTPARDGQRPAAISRARSSTIIGTTTATNGPPSASGFGIVTDTTIDGTNQTYRRSSAFSHQSAIAGPSKPRVVSQPQAQTQRPRNDSSRSHQRGASWPSPPMPTLATSPSAPVVSTRGSIDTSTDDIFPSDRCQLVLYTYKPNPNTTQPPQPTPLPSSPSIRIDPHSTILVSHASLPWQVRPGDYLEIRRVRSTTGRLKPSSRGIEDGPKSGGEALRGVKKGSERDGCVFRLGEDTPNVPATQIQVPESVASAFNFQHRLEVEVVRLPNPAYATADYIELRFSQYLGRADMWRLGMSLENQTVHVGERVSLAGGAVRAEIYALWRGNIRYSSGIVTSKTKTIYRSRSAQVYLFIQLCQETYEFDEDGERYYEKVVHGFLPELFEKWRKKSASHIVTIVLFARIHYDPEEVAYLEEHDLTCGLTKDYAGRWCKDFFRVAIDFERRNDWTQALPEIKKTLESCEREILLDFHLDLMKSKGKERADQKKRILGTWSFAYEGNILEAINLALNPFDEHYVDRDLSRTGLCMTVITPGTGHFAVDKALLRLTTERMVDHGIGLDLVCLTKMPLHSVPLFSYISNRPKLQNEGVISKPRPQTPDLLYFDAKVQTGVETELSDCYSISKWVYASFYSKTHDKPFRKDRFIPRCKMYEIQMLGILDHNLTTVIVPLLDASDNSRQIRRLSPEERKAVRDDFDSTTFSIRQEGEKPSPPGSITGAGAIVTVGDRLSVPASFQSARLLARKEAESRTNSTSSEAPRHRLSMTSARPLLEVEPLDLSRTALPATSPVPSSLSMHRIRQRSGTLLSQTQSQASEQSPSRKTTRQPSVTTGSRQSSRSTDDTSESQHSIPSLILKATQGPPINRSPQIWGTSPSKSSTLSGGEVLPDPAWTSGQSTPRSSNKKLNSKPSKGSMGILFGLFGARSGGRSQPSFPTAAAATVGRQAVSIPPPSDRDKPSSPESNSVKSPSAPLAVPGAPEIIPSTPSPARERYSTQPLPMPIAATNKRIPKVVGASEDEVAKSLTRSGGRMSRSPRDDSWGRSANLGQASRHVTVNPCNPKINQLNGIGEERRWQHIRPKAIRDVSHPVKWQSLCAPACLPLTTDYLPTQEEVAEFYSVNSYELACVGEGSSFLVRSDAAGGNVALATLREMASQRLSQNFQFIVLPHDQHPGDEDHRPPNKILMPGEAMADSLRVGGASEALRNATGVVYLILSHIIHRLACDTNKQSVTVQRFVRRIKYSMDPIHYKCLVLPVGGKRYDQVESTFRYPISSVEGRLGFNFLDRLIAGEEDHFDPQIRYWRTRYILIPSGRDPSPGIIPKGENFNLSEILFTGAYKVLEILGRHQWTKNDEKPKKLRLLPTTFDPSACVLDPGLMSELERLLSGEESERQGKKLEGMTLGEVGDLMCIERNGLVIRDRWWNFVVHEDSFTGEQFCEWLMKTFDDVVTADQASEWGRSLLDKGLIEHVIHEHGFLGFSHFYYRLRPAYDRNAKKRSALSWFGGSKGTPSRPEEALQRHAALSTSPAVGNRTLATLIDDKDALTSPERTKNGKIVKKKITMSQSCIIDLDPGKKSDRAEMAWLHADFIHNCRNAFHFELNWVGVTAGLLDELRSKCSAQADRYGLRFVEVPVEQIKDIQTKCAYRSPYQIKLALAPPIIPDLHLRLAEQHGTGQSANFFEYAILTTKFGFILDVEASDRYPETISVEYAYRAENKFEYSQFCHKSGVALVQCVGGEEGFLWTDNRLFIAAPTRGSRGATGGGGETYPHAPLLPKLSKQEEAKALREELEKFCGDKEALRAFYEEVTPRPLEGEKQVEEGKNDKLLEKKE